MPLLFLIDDDVDVLDLNKKYFQSENYTVFTFENAASALEVLPAYHPDCIVLDIMMPDIDGYMALKEIRKISQTPVIFLTGRDSEDEKVEGLISGADDYLIKPYSLRELSARIQVQLRKQASSVKKNLVKGYRYPPLTMDFINHKIMYNEAEEISISNREYEVLYLLMANANQLVTYRQIGEKLYQYYTESDRRTIMVIVSRLRKKMSDYNGLENFIESIYGKGYMFTPGKRGNQ